MIRWAALLIVFASPALGQVRPTPSGSDPMQQSVTFHEGQTVVLETAAGFQLTVEFGEREQIRSAAAGNSAAWQVSAPANGNHVFVRPVEGAATTNLTVVTDRHTYYFLLVPAATMTSQNALSVRFAYPQEATVPAAAARSDPASSSVSAGSYRLSGATSLRPSLIWDDGAKTYLDWPEGVELPAVFAIDASGGETLVNGYVRNGRYVIDAVFSRLLFRLDRLLARADRRMEKAS